MLKHLATRTYVAIGLSFILVSILLVALLLGLIPDRHGVVRENRAALAEAIAASSSGLIGRDDIERMRNTLRLVVDRNADLRSAALRRADGERIVTVGDHARHWRDLDAAASTDTFVKVPLRDDGRRWGQLELRYAPVGGNASVPLLGDPRSALFAFVLVAAFFAFRFYLGNVLKHLDPSQAVPPHVRSALDTLAEGLLVVDKNETVVLANAAFAALVGRTPEQLVGHRASAIGFMADGNAINAASAPWSLALDQGRPLRNTMLSLMGCDQREHAFIVNCSPVLGSGGEHAGVLISLDDVTELEANKVELRASKDAAEAANQAKSDFLANMSHEIRTPMNAILGFTDVLRRGYDRSAAERTQYLDTIHQSGSHLLQLINDVLDLSKVEAGRLEVESIPTAAHQLVKEVMTVLRVKAREKGIELNVYADSDLPATIATDPTRLRQIATNLIGNALKFTDSGEVQVRFDLQAHDIYRLRVIDSGIGIPADKLDSVFEAFVQADTSVTRQFGGTGLGLAISRRFARLLGGDIVAHSILGEGTEFEVTINPGTLDDVARLSPAEVLADDVAAAPDDDSTWAFPPSTRVLVVDDGEENRELLRLVLENTGLETACAENGQEAVDLALVHRFDAILLDMQMPVMDGYTAAARLREAGLELPILALTADAMKGFERKCLDAGCSHYLTKPVDIDNLLNLLAGLLDGTRVAATAPAQRPAFPAPSADAADQGPIVSKLAGAGPAIQATIAKFVDGLPDRFEGARDALARGELEELARFAHWLKGAGGTVGFEGFTEPADRLEQRSIKGDAEGAAALLAELEGRGRRLQRPETDAAVPQDSAAAATAPAAAAAPTYELPAGPIACALPLANPRLRQTVVRFLERLEARIDELDQAVVAGDIAAVAEIASWLKGAAPTVGFGAFAGPAAYLESAAASGDTASFAPAATDLRALFDQITHPAELTPEEPPAAQQVRQESLAASDI